jgi:hypothetical protein
LHQISLPRRKDYFLFFHFFPTCSIQIPNGFASIILFFNEGITQDGEWNGFGCHKGGVGGGTKKGKKWGVGGGERHCGDQKVFGRHTSVMTKNLSIATQLW